MQTIPACRAISGLALSLGMLLVLGSCSAPQPVAEPQPEHQSGTAVASQPEEGGSAAARTAEAEILAAERTVLSEQQVASITPARTVQVQEMAEQYPDAVGWLTVPGTDLDVPIMLNPPGYNNYYTTHDIEGNPSTDGAYGVDHRASLDGGRDQLSRNTTLYAHNHDDDPDGILFAQLKRFKDSRFAAEHPYVFFSTAQEDMAFEIFAVYDATTDFPYIQADLSWSKYQQMLDVVGEANLYDYGGAPITPEDRILTLSTCTFSVPGHSALPTTVQNEYRFIIMARLMDPKELWQETADFIYNEAILAPDDLPDFAAILFDQLWFAGVEYENLELRYKQDPCMQRIDSTRLEQVGQVQRTIPIPSETDEPQDGDATWLSPGTQLYRNLDYSDMLLVLQDGEWIPYRALRERPTQHYTATLWQGDLAVAVRTVQGEDPGDLEGLVNMLHHQSMPGSVYRVTPSADGRRITVASTDALSTWTQTFWLGSGDSIGGERMIARQSDGFYYNSSTVFDQYWNLIENMPQ